MQKLNGETKDIVAENIEKLKQLFPEAFSEGKVQTDVLETLLGDYKETEPERYSFNWNGKAMARREAQKVSTGTLRPCPEESVDWDTTQNLYIEGDNLEVLKLLQKSYHNKIKMIYIDPPYNTGKEFVYKDNYHDNLQNYKELTGQTDEEGKRLSTNSETAGRYHSNWLNMMYPRLKLARNLLKDDGVIFISIDDHEVQNLRKICDEIFGEINFIADLIWEKRYGRSNDAKLMASSIDHILLYKKSETLVKLREARSESANKGYSNPDNDPRGLWTSVSFVSQRTKDERPNLSYTLQNPNTQKLFDHPTNSWKYSKDKYDQLLGENRFYWGKDGSQDFPRIKRFLSELDEGMVPINLWKFQDSGTGDEGTKEVNSLIGKDIFSYPKPTKLLKRAISLGFYPKIEEGVVLDFFAGSCSTAHAILDMNKEDGGKRKYIMTQLPEPTEENTEAFKAGYKTISEIGKERIRRVIKKIENDDPVIAKTMDLGFKVFKLDSSNIKAWDPATKDLELSLQDAITNIKEDRTQDDVLYEILLKFGLDLTLPIVEKDISGNKVFNIGLGALLVCLADNITLDTVEEIGKLKDKLKPETCRVVFKDNGFTDDVAKTNAMQIMKRYGIEEVRSI